MAGASPGHGGQFRLAHAPLPQRNTKDGVVLIPVGVALWAGVSRAIDQALSENLDKQVWLRTTSGRRETICG